MFTSRYAGKRRLLSLATAVALVSPGVTLAQDEADESETTELEEIVVTGTRLQKSSFEQTTPNIVVDAEYIACLLYTSPSPRDQRGSRMPSSA